MYFIIQFDHLLHLYIGDIRGFGLLRNHFLNKTQVVINGEVHDNEFFHYIVTPNYYRILQSELLSRMTEIKVNRDCVYDEINA